MNAIVGDDWRLLQALEEQEHRSEDTLRLIYLELVVSKKLDRDRFNELCYLTRCRANFD